mgnify:CR=1 FL=1
MILDGVRENRWRILVGDDAHIAHDRGHVAADGIRHQGKVCIQSRSLVILRQIFIFFHQFVRKPEAPQAKVLGQHQLQALVPAQRQTGYLLAGVQMSFHFFTQQINAPAAHDTALLPGFA